MFVFSVALFLRIAAVFWLDHVPYSQGGDAPRYLSIARDVLAHREYGVTSGDTTRVPLYPLFLAVHLWIFGDALIWVAVSQAVIDAVTAVLLAWTALELTAGRRSWVVGLLWATYPPAILNTVAIFTQPLQVFWLVVALWTLVAGMRRHSTWRCAAAATLWGVSCLTRAGNVFFLPVFAAAPLLWEGLRRGRSVGWAWKASMVMLVCGASSVLWWTARDFPATYRLQDLLLNAKERRAVALLISPLQPIPDQVAAWLRDRTAPIQGKAEPAVLAIPPEETVGVTLSDWRAELRRVWQKLWQTFGAPDGCVQLGCTGPTGGYWATARSQFVEHPLSVFTLAGSEPCLVLKSLMYLEHYALLLLAIPGFVILARYAPGVMLLVLLYVGYTVVTIILGSNYSATLAAVPRFAFSIMPVLVLLTGLLSIDRVRIGGSNRTFHERVVSTSFR